jgi:hypothetical protein
MRGRFKWYQSRRLAVGLDPYDRGYFLSRFPLDLSPLNSPFHMTLTFGPCLVLDG